MRKRRWFNISLATKCQLLFGVAVLLIVAATLFLPWRWNPYLSAEADKARAEKAAMAARLNFALQSTDWSGAQQQLADRWPALVRDFQLSTTEPPQLISVADEEEFQRMAPRGFIVESFAKFRQHPNELYQWKEQPDDEGRRIVRLAMAVRADVTASNPGALLGLINVRVPIQMEIRKLAIIVYVLSGASGCALSTLVFYLVTQKLFLSPVRQLTRVAQKVADGGLDVRSKIATGDEFEELGQAFNDMLGHLQSTQEELRTINRSLDVRLGELAETNVALFEANRLKGEFLANVSHELRTPLSSIIGFAELARDALESPPADPAKPIRYTDNILSSGRMLLDLINDLLDLAKIEAGKLELHITEFDPAIICGDLMDLVRPLADKKNLDLAADVPAFLPSMRSDSGRVKQILYNLLSNAIKFTPEKGRVMLSAEPLGSPSADQIALRVSDSGPGIAKDQQKSIFEKFRQLDSSVTRPHGGTGLGLAITRELAHLLGGTITVDSDEGRGSTFTVTLPLETPLGIRPPLVRLT